MANVTKEEAKYLREHFISKKCSGQWIYQI